MAAVSNRANTKLPDFLPFEIINGTYSMPGDNFPSITHFTDENPALLTHASYQGQFSFMPTTISPAMSFSQVHGHSAPEASQPSASSGPSIASSTTRSPHSNFAHGNDSSEQWIAPTYGLGLAPEGYSNTGLHTEQDTSDTLCLFHGVVKEPGSVSQSSTPLRRSSLTYTWSQIPCLPRRYIPPLSPMMDSPSSIHHIPRL